MRSFLKSQHSWDVVRNEFIQPNPTTLHAIKNNQRNFIVENKKKDDKALLIMYNEVEESVFPKIAATTKAYQACEILVTTYQGIMNKVKNEKLQILRNFFETHQLKDRDFCRSFYDSNYKCCKLASSPC